MALSPSSRTRRQCLEMYGRNCTEFPDFPGKRFKCLLGIEGEMVPGNNEWNKNKKRKQYLYRPGNYKVVSLEIHCVQGEHQDFQYVPKTDEHYAASAKRQAKRHERQIKSIEPFISKSFDPCHPDHQRLAGPQPPKRVPGPARTPARPGNEGKKLKRWETFLCLRPKPRKKKKKKRKATVPEAAPRAVGAVDAIDPEPRSSS